MADSDEDSDSGSPTTFDELKAFDIAVDQLHINDFILVRYTLKMPIYVGQIEECESCTTFRIKFLRRHLNTWKFIFPLTNDIVSIAADKIISKLPDPHYAGGTRSRRCSMMTFACDLTNFHEVR